jgi:hypothetical protein
VLHLVALVLGLVALRRSAVRALDLGLYDETGYLTAGRALLRHGALPTDLETSPLYVAWYAPFHALLGDPVDVYFAQWLVTDALLALALFAALRIMGRGAGASLAATLAWAALEVNSVGWPRVYFFALLVALTGVLAEARWGRSLSIAGFATATLARPEYALPLVGAIVLAVAARWPAAARRAALPVALAAVVSAGALAASGRWGGGRVFFAFQQHYALEHAADHPGLVRDSWIEYAAVVERELPGVTTLGGALRAHPGKVLAFVAHNAASVPVVVARALVRTPWLPPGLSYAWVALAALGLALGRARAGAPAPPPPPAARRVLVGLALAALAVLPSLVVAAKPAYSLPLVLLGVVLLARGLDDLGRAAAARAGRRTLGELGFVAPFAAPVALVLLVRAPASPHLILDTVHGVRAVFAAQPAGTTWTMLEAVGDLCAYVDPDRCRRVAHTDKPEATPLSAFAAERRVDAVLVSHTLLLRADYAADPTVAALLDRPEAVGFVRAWASPVAALFLAKR